MDPSGRRDSERSAGHTADAAAFEKDLDWQRVVAGLEALARPQASQTGNGQCTSVSAARRLYAPLWVLAVAAGGPRTGVRGGRVVNATYGKVGMAGNVK